ncbi:MAG: DUF2169 domain-containing protein [Myxococcaceae bacterium]
MMPPELNTRSESAAVGMHPQLNLDGSVLTVVVIKQSFSILPGRECVTAAGAEIRMVDDPWDPDAESSSIRYPTDVCLHKPGADVIVVGEAIARGEVAVPELTVNIEVGPVKKALRVFGPRVWYKGLLGLTPSDPLPFVRRELRWDYAWGGPDERRNPRGIGADAEPAALLGKPVACIEDPSNLIRTPKTRPNPAGVGAIGPDFAPRLHYAGTMNQRWQEERAPLRPTDFDPRFFQAACPEMVVAAPFKGGEPVRIEGMHPEGTLAFALPKAWFGVAAEFDKGRQEYRPVLDTILIEPEALSLDFTWRSVIPTPTQSTRLRAIEVWEKALA